MDKSIDIQRLCFNYPKQELLTDFTLRLAPGQIHCIIGKKNEGKTSLMKLISGQLFPSSGKLEVTHLLPGKRSVEVLQNIFYLPEEIVLPPVSMETFESIYAPFYPKYNADNFYKYLNDFTIDNHIDSLDTLPEGEKRKFLIAFAIATHTHVLLLDEPTKGMDSAGIQTTGRLLKREINRKKCILIGTERAVDMDEIGENFFLLKNHRITFNQQLIALQEKLFFGTSANKPDTEGLLYYEETRKNFSFMRKREDTDSVTGINCELLFNALADDNLHSTINELFSTHPTLKTNRDI